MPLSPLVTDGSGLILFDNPSLLGPLLLVGNIAGASVGPTGSGAANIWAALDGVVAQAWYISAFQVGVTPGINAFVEFEVAAYPITRAFDTSDLLIGRSWIHNSVSTVQVGQNGFGYVVPSAAGVFNIRTNTTGLTAPQLTLLLKGYIPA